MTSIRSTRLPGVGQLLANPPPSLRLQAADVVVVIGATAAALEILDSLGEA